MVHDVNKKMEALFLPITFRNLCLKPGAYNEREITLLLTTIDRQTDRQKDGQTGIDYLLRYLTRRGALGKTT